MLKRLFLFLLLVFATYAAKPYWEEPLSQYVDLSFLEPVDETIESIITSETFQKTVHYVNDTIDQVILFFIKDQDSTTTNTRDVEKPALDTPAPEEISIHNLNIGTSFDTVSEVLGEPVETTLNEYGEQWSIYHQDYHNFMMISYDDARNINAIYTNDDLIASNTGLQYGAQKKDIRDIYGEPLTEIRKGNHIFVLQDSEEFDLFEVNNMYIYVFYDIHRDNQVTALQLISKALEQEQKRIYGDASEALKNGFEKQLFHLTNASRVRHGLMPLEWEERAANTARKHSIDMARHNYFSHENLQGLSPFDRMKADHLSFRSAGENLAYGQSSSIFAHEGLMNSKGHRENILFDQYSHLGVGVSFNEKSQPYYTENFLLK